MRAVVQKVTESFVSVNGDICGRIGNGMNVLVGVTRTDTTADADYIVRKLLGLRIFDDENEVMNENITEHMARVGGEPQMLVISQFTLCGDARKGNRPSYFAAQEPTEAAALYEYVIAELRKANIHVETGIFRTDMKVHIVNDGPVTILLDSEKVF